MDQASDQKLFKFEGGRIYFTRRTERLFFFVMSLIMIGLVGLHKLGVF